MLAGLSVNEWELLERKAIELCGDMLKPQDTDTVEADETEYKKTVLNSVQRRDSTALNTTAGTGVSEKEA